MSNKTRNILKWLGHIIICSLFITIFCTLADFVDTPIKSFKDIFFIFVQWSIISAGVYAVLSILSLLGKWIYTIIYSILVCIAATLAYFRYTINFSFNTMILDIIFQNDVTVSADMVTIPLIIWMLIMTIGGFLLAKIRGKYKIYYGHWATITNIIISILLIYVILQPNGRFKLFVTERIPFNIYNVTTKYVMQHQEIATERPRQCSYANNTIENDSTVVVVVIGEALRPSNLSINGYYRKTTPKIEAAGFISLDSVFTDYGYTNKSVPHLLTRANSDNPGIAYKERSFIDVYKAANIHTATITNQDAEKPYIYFINEADTTIKSNQSKTVYNFDKWLDEDVLPPYNDLLKEREQQLILIHTIGSHWWYCSHYSDEYEIFKPTMKSRMLNNCDSMEIVNSYDNTVLYTDYILSEIIKPLKDKNAILIFLSDHGEALGENNLWLHAGESPWMYHTTGLIWMSEKYKKEHPERLENLIKNKSKKMKTDFLYHSAIVAGNIESDVVDKKLSIFH